MKLGLVGFLILASTFFQATPPSYSGQWKNLTNDQKGPLTVTAVQMEDKTWKTTFVGKLDETAFDYEIIMGVVKGREANGSSPLELQGNVNAGGAMFIVSINMNEDQLNGQFSSSSSNGEFQLTRKR